MSEKTNHLIAGLNSVGNCDDQIPRLLTLLNWSMAELLKETELLQGAGGNIRRSITPGGGSPSRLLKITILNEDEQLMNALADLGDCDNVVERLEAIV